MDIEKLVQVFINKLSSEEKEKIMKGVLNRLEIIKEGKIPEDIKKVFYERLDDKKTKSEVKKIEIQESKDKKMNNKIKLNIKTPKLNKLNIKPKL